MSNTSNCQPYQIQTGTPRVVLKVLVVEDDSTVCSLVVSAIRAAGHSVQQSANGELALECLERQVFDLVISDVCMPKFDGLSLFERVRERWPEVGFILMTAHGDVADAVKSVKAGAVDYITKPFELAELVDRLEQLARRLWLERQAVPSNPGADTAAARLIGESPLMLQLRQRIATLSQSNATAVIYGESGTGKELVARAIHESKSPESRPFVAVNCAAFPETLIEAELFGHERGAFTGASAKRDGRFKVAEGGTLLLDEVGELTPSVQVKLLRVVQERCFEPLGSNRSIPFNVRLLCATHRDLKQLVAEGKFREDLYYRLNVLDVSVPPLRARTADIPLLVAHFVQKFEPNKKPNLTPEAWAALMAHRYPGNVRELEHAIHRAVVLSEGGPVERRHLPPDIAGVLLEDPSAPSSSKHSLSLAMRSYERQCILQALAASKGRKAAAAQLLGITRKTLWEKLKLHQVSDSELPKPA